MSDNKSNIRGNIIPRSSSAEVSPNAIRTEAAGIVDTSLIRDNIILTGDACGGISAS